MNHRINRTAGKAQARKVARQFGCEFIMLGNGKFALVDKKDFKRLNTIVWSCAARGYAVHVMNPKKGEAKNPVLYMHRVVLRLNKEDPQVDHRNRNKLDNRRCNLRLANHSQQAGNVAKKNFKKRLTSKFKGVCWDGSRPSQAKWMAQGRKNGRMVYLGRFDDERLAAAAYNTWAKGHFGKFAYLNPL